MGKKSRKAASVASVPATAAPARRSMTVTQSNPEFVRILGLDGFMGASATGEPMTVDKALSVPAIWSAVNFIGGTIAGLPLHTYRRRRGGERERVKTGVAPILADAVSDEMTSFDWRKYTFDQVLTGGRGFTFIERSPSGKVMNLWPLDPGCMTVRKDRGRRSYTYKEGGSASVYEASEIIDLPFMQAADMTGHRSPIQQCRDAVALAVGATQYGARYFSGGGVPPFVVTGKFQSAQALQRAADDLSSAVREASKNNRLALTLPEGLDIKPLGGDPEKNQFNETRRMAVEEVARIYSLPPVFLQDLTHGTFSNTEQQDLHFVKHTLRRWIEQFEQELNLKLFGRGASEYVEFNVDGLLRGDFKTRMDGIAQGIQSATLTPNEAREMENRPPKPGGDRLVIQGAMVPLELAGDNNGGQSDGEV